MRCCQWLCPWALSAALLAPLATAGELTGTWEGNFSCKGIDYTWQVALDNTVPNKLEGQAVFTRVADGAQGAHKVGGQFNPRTLAVTVTPRGWIQRVKGRAQLGFRGSYQSSSSVITGRFIDTSCGALKLRRSWQQIAMPAPGSQPARAGRSPSPTAASTVSASAPPPKGTGVGRGQTAASTVAKADETRCNAILAWSDKLEKAFPDKDFYQLPEAQVIPYLPNLFDDEHFVPLFGKPFDTMSKADRSEIGSKEIRRCFHRPELKTAYDWQIFYLDKPFVMDSGPVSGPAVSEQIRANRQTLEWLSETRQELSNLQSAAEHYQRLLKVRSEVRERLHTIWPRYWQSFDAETVPLLEASAQLELTRVVNVAIGEATSIGDAAELRAVLNKNAALAQTAGLEAETAAQADIEAHLSALAEAAADDLWRDLVALGTGIDALNKQIEWYNRYQDLVERTSPAPAALADLQARFLAHREATWIENEAALESMMKNAASTTEIGQKRPIMTNHDRNIASAKRISRIAWERRKALVESERNDFFKRWGDIYALKPPRESLRVRQADLFWEMPPPKKTIVYQPVGYQWDPLLEPYGPTFFGFAGHQLAKAAIEYNLGREALADEIERLDSARYQYFICDDKCEDKEFVAQYLRRLLLLEDWAVAAWKFSNQAMGFSASEQAEMKKFAKTVANVEGWHPGEARLCESEVEPWSRCVVERLRARKNADDSMLACWDLYEVVDACRNPRELLAQESRYMTIYGRLIKHGVDQDLAFLAKGVEEFYDYGAHDVAIAKAQDYLTCFGEPKMKELSRIYLSNKPSKQCARKDAPLVCVHKELGVSGFNPETGEPWEHWSCPLVVK